MDRAFQGDGDWKYVVETFYIDFPEANEMLRGLGPLTNRQTISRMLLSALSL